jgi:ABC-type transport system involved in cytochrome c biogenesis permease subunit
MNFIARIAPWITAVLGLAYLGAGAYPRAARPGQADLFAFGALPVQDGGRLKPIDTYARNTLTAINSRQNYFKDLTEATEKPAPPNPSIEWMLAVWGADPATGTAADAPVFRITDLQLVDYFGLKKRPGFWRYSLNELRPKYEQFERDVKRLAAQRKTDPAHMTAFDDNLLELAKHVSIYVSLGTRHDPRVVSPQTEDQEWRTVGDIEDEAKRAVERKAVNQARDELLPGVEIQKMTDEQYELIRPRYIQLIDAEMPSPAKWIEVKRPQLSPAAEAFVNLFRLYRAEKYDEFNAAVTAYRDTYLAYVPAAELTRVHWEAIYNRVSPFYNSMILYVLAFLMVCGSWVLSGLRWESAAVSLRRSAFALVSVTAVVHLAALFCRMYLMNRWFVFVTNLYSSAIFIGWACVALGLLIELLFGRGFGVAVASIIGASTLLIAYFLGLDGDNLNMLQAVLDTNFWLATHVTTVTLGYSATYFAGIFGLVYILAGVCTPVLTGDVRKSLGQVTYGVICFATMLSFTGTVLGGIWADQSWGRFWGWDPKENGALMIVIWNALILHARWGGLVKQRGVAVLAVFGCVVTTWSYFGTNQLGVGFHSYGFTTGRAVAIFWTSVGFTLLTLVGTIPTRFWMSTRAELAARGLKKPVAAASPA